MKDKRPLIEVETEEFPKEDRLNVQIRFDLKFALLAILLVVIACGATIWTVVRLLGG